MARIPPWRWSFWGPWPPDGFSLQDATQRDDAIKARAHQLAKHRPWCTDEQNWIDARLELNSPPLLRWRPTLLRWLGASEKTGWDWIDLMLKLSIPLTVALGGWAFNYFNGIQQNEIARKNQKDAVIRDYIKEIKGMLLDGTIAAKAKRPGSEANGVARALTLTALGQLKGEGPERRSLVFQFLRESDFPILAGSNKQRGANLSGYDLNETDLTGADLREADLYEAELVEAKLFKADLRAANLFKANLSGANLSEADLRKTFLKESVLKGADLIEANLMGADLRSADLTEADLFDANLIAADLSYANLKDIKWSAETKWPDRNMFVRAINIPEQLKRKLGL